ncbi:MAG: alpha-L-rhamnosidase [Clostridia bacterium]|nr:alpha-L-rhamnosidase [Clostridia bacterium]
MDQRTRKDVFPQKIVLVNGDVKNAENLLSAAPLQITTDEPNCAVLANGSDGNCAEVLLDFGIEMNAAPRILTHVIMGENPARVRIVAGESVSEAMSDIGGEKNATNDHALRDYETLLPQFSDMTFSESGFRFLRLRLESPNTTLRIKSIAATAIYRDIPYLGTFECSNETINKIYSTAAYTCHQCMQQFVWDGIKRDRLVWVGDMHPEMLTIRTVFGTQKVFEDSLSFMRDQTPVSGWMNGMPSYSLWWLIMAWDWYFYTGNKAFLEENRGYALALADKIQSLVDENGEDRLPGYFLDWPSHDTDWEQAGTRALMALALEKCELLCAELGNPELGALCKAKAELICKTPLNTHGAKQVEAMAALAGWKNMTEAGENILICGAKGFSTFMSYYLFTVAAAKDSKQALSVLESYYGAMLSLGATTFWEDFNVDWLGSSAAPIDAPVKEGENDIHGDHGAFCYIGLRHSLCHGWSSAVTAFLAETVLGIKIAAPGCREIVIRPDLCGLDFARGTYPTPHGVLSVSVTKDEKGLSVDYTAPEGVKVRIEK